MWYWNNPIYNNPLKLSKQLCHSNYYNIIINMDEENYYSNGIKNKNKKMSNFTFEIYLPIIIIYNTIKVIYILFYNFD